MTFHQVTLRQFGQTCLLRPRLYVSIDAIRSLRTAEFTVGATGVDGETNFSRFCGFEFGLEVPAVGIGRTWVVDAHADHPSEIVA